MQLVHARFSLESTAKTACTATGRVRRFNCDIAKNVSKTTVHCICYSRIIEVVDRCASAKVVGVSQESQTIVEEYAQEESIDSVSLNL